MLAELGSTTFHVSLIFRENDPAGVSTMRVCALVAGLHRAGSLHLS